MASFPEKYKYDPFSIKSTMNQNYKRKHTTEPDDTVKRRRIESPIYKAVETSATPNTIKGCAANERLKRLRQNIEISKIANNQAGVIKPAYAATNVNTYSGTHIHNNSSSITKGSNNNHSSDNKTNMKISMQDRLITAQKNARLKPDLKVAPPNSISAAKTFSCFVVKYPETKTYSSTVNKDPQMKTFNATVNKYPETKAFNSSVNKYLESNSTKLNSPLLYNTVNIYPQMKTFSTTVKKYPETKAVNSTVNRYPESTNTKLTSTKLAKCNGPPLTVKSNSPLISKSNSPQISNSYSPQIANSNSLQIAKFNNPLIAKSNSPLVANFNNPLHVSNKSETITSSIIQNTNQHIYNPGQQHTQERKRRFDKFGNENDHLSESSDSSEDMEMEWSTIDPEELISDIRCVREERNMQPDTNRSAFTERIIQEHKSEVTSRNKNYIYVIVDTNVFINCLQTISNILHLTYEDDTSPVIFVPWMVIQELDYFKDGYSVSQKFAKSKVLQKQAMAAIRFINDCLLSKRSNFEGQSVRDAANYNLNGSNPDDSILSCCFQAGLTKRVILLTSDTNLRNKALINRIETCTPTDILNVLKRYNNTKKKNTFIVDVSGKLSLLFSYLISTELKKCFGEVLYNRKNLKPLPWSFVDCIKYMKEYYRDVFQTHLQKQSEKVINDLYNILLPNDCVPNNMFIELIWSLLIYIKSGLPQYARNIEHAIVEIKQLESKN